jgi:hypothetical protein
MLVSLLDSRLGLDPAHDEERKDDDQNDAQPAAREVAPIGAVRPARQRADKQKKDDDQQDGA